MLIYRFYWCIHRFGILCPIQSGAKTFELQLHRSTIMYFFVYILIMYITSDEKKQQYNHLEYWRTHQHNNPSATTKPSHLSLKASNSKHTNSISPYVSVTPTPSPLHHINPSYDIISTPTTQPANNIRKKVERETEGKVFSPPPLPLPRRGLHCYVDFSRSVVSNGVDSSEYSFTFKSAVVNSLK